MATKSSIMDTNSYSDDFVSLLSATTKDMISRREKWMGGAYRLFYRKPVNLVAERDSIFGMQRAISTSICITM